MPQLILYGKWLGEDYAGGLGGENWLGMEEGGGENRDFLVASVGLEYLLLAGHNSLLLRFQVEG